MPDPEDSEPLIVVADAVPTAGADAMFGALLGHFSGGAGEGDLDPEIVKTLREYKVSGNPRGLRSSTAWPRSCATQATRVT